MYACKKVTSFLHNMGLQKFQWGRNTEHFYIILHTMCKQFLNPWTQLLSFFDE